MPDEKATEEKRKEEEARIVKEYNETRKVEEENQRRLERILNASD